MQWWGTSQSTARVTSAKNQSNPLLTFCLSKPATCRSQPGSCCPQLAVSHFGLGAILDPALLLLTRPMLLSLLLRCAQKKILECQPRNRCLHSALNARQSKDRRMRLRKRTWAPNQSRQTAFVFLLTCHEISDQCKLQTTRIHK